MTDKERLQKILDTKPGPIWCWLMEEATGEIGNYMIRKWEYDLAEKYHPDIFRFTVDDLLNCDSADDIPEDWIKYLCACIDKYDIDVM